MLFVSLINYSIRGIVHILERTRSGALSSLSTQLQLLKAPSYTVANKVEARNEIIEVEKVHCRSISFYFSCYSLTRSAVS